MALIFRDESGHRDGRLQKITPEAIRKFHARLADYDAWIKGGELDFESALTGAVIAGI